MKKLTFVLFLAALVGLAFTDPVEVVSYKVDASNSQVEWLAKKVTGQHNGSVALEEGNLEYTDGRLSGGKFVVDMTSITVLDLQGNMKGKLEGHLKSPDFFAIEEFPTATFEITKVVPRGVPGEYKVEGDLTVKGITKEITVPIIKMEESEDGIKTVEAINLTLDRTDFDVRYGSGTFFSNLGDKTIYDDFELTINVVANKAM
ncbi:MAG TPA: YceI family protein [Saprospiraceae bacterium]|nr:YceI family protein [Saprospiraceae bacterium]